jgi:hypothetical protein
MEYDTLSFLIELKSELLKSLNSNKITDEEYSLLLGQAKGHIKKKKDQIRNNPEYVIPFNILNQYSENIIRKFGNDAQMPLILFKKYIANNDVPKAIFGIHRFHPNLKVDYFKNVIVNKKHIG